MKDRYAVPVREVPQKEDFRLYDGFGPVGFGGYDHDSFSAALADDTGQDSIVQQQFAEEVDINTIVRRFGLTREMPSGVAGGVYGDFSGITDYESALSVIERAQEGFMVLPPDVRERFDNDPGKLIQAIHELPEGDVLELMTPSAPAAPVVPVSPVAPVVP